MVLHYQIHAASTLEHKASATQEAAPRRKTRDVLLSWFRAVLPLSNITNFTTDWNDGLNLSTLVDYCKPGLIPNHATLDPNNGLQNVTNAMDLAEENFGIPQVMHPEDLAVEKPDEQSVMTYLSYFCRSGFVGHNNLIEWVNSVLPDRNISNFLSEWRDSQNLCALVKAFAPDALPPQSTLETQSARENIHLALEAAEQELGIAAPKDFLSPSAHPLSVMTYLTHFQFLGRDPVHSPHLAAVGPGIAGVEVGKDAAFSFEGDIPSENDLAINITSPDGSLIDLEQTVSPTGTASYHYTPSVPGLYTVNVLYSGEHIDGSPYYVTHREPTSPAHCRVSGKGVTRACVGMAAEFLVDCSTAGRGSLGIEVEPPFNDGNIFATVSSKPDGIYQVRFVPESIGDHMVRVNWGGIPIPNSPFICQVTNPSMCVASGSGLSTAILGHTASFQVATEGAGPGSLSATVYGPSQPVELSLLSSQDDVYAYAYTPQQNGTYLIDIKWNGFPVRGSPFTVRPEPATIASKCFVREMPVGRMQVGKAVGVIVDTTATGGEERAAITASVRGPSMDEDCEIVTIEKGVYGISFHPQLVGEYTVDIVYGGSPIPDSPLDFTVNDPSKCEVNVEMVSSGLYQTGKPVTFRASTYNAGEGTLTAAVRAPGEDIRPKVVDEGEGKYVVSFTPPDAGTHIIDVLFDGQSFLYAPITINVENSLQNIVLTKPVSHTGYHLADTLLEFRLFAPNREASRFAVSALGMQTGAIPSTEFITTGDDTFSINFRAAYPDDYRVEITYEQLHLPGSPFTLPIRTTPCADKVMSFDPIVPLRTGMPIELIFDASQAGVGALTTDITSASSEWVVANVEEVSGNLYSVSFIPHQNDTFTINVFWSGLPVNASPFTIHFEEQLKEPPVSVMFEPEMGVRGMLSASVVGQNMGKVATSVQQFEQGKYQISFSPPRKDIYNLHLFWFDQEVKGSPFKLDLISPQLQRKRQQHASMVTLPIDLAERRGVLSALAVGERMGPVPIDLSLTQKKDHVRIVFKDRVRDSYDLFLFWNHRLLKGAPFKLEPPMIVF